MKNGDSNLFFGGIPTKPDVDKLRDRFGVPAEGKLIEYDEIEAVIREPKGSDRFLTVTTAWRRALLRENNVVMDAVPCRGFIALNPNDRVEFAVSGYRKGFRKVGRSIRVAETTDRARMSEEAKSASDHLNRVGAAVRLAIATAAREIELPT